MLTLAQMTSFDTMLADVSDEDRVPPRYVTIPMHDQDELVARLGEDGYREAFGDGTILFVGMIEREMTDDCDCGEPHILYALVRADGLTSDTYVSGTLGEALMGPPQLWDEAHAVDPAMWPTVDLLD